MSKQEAPEWKKTEAILEDAGKKKKEIYEILDDDDDDFEEF